MINVCFSVSRNGLIVLPYNEICFFKWNFWANCYITITYYRNSNLTHKFYAEKAIRYIKQTHLTNKWYHFISLPPEEQLLEKAAVMVAQWCQPQEDLRYSKIASQLDEIAENVKQLLWETNSSHPLFTTPAETLQNWRSCNIPDNQWKPNDSQQVLNCLREILFIQMGFHGNNSMYYSAENSFIDKVYKKH